MIFGGFVLVALLPLMWAWGIAIINEWEEDE